MKGRPHYYSAKKEEYAHIKFDLDADLSSLFTWNTKQVFVWIAASYPSSSSRDSRSSSAIVWDAILPSPSSPEHQNYYNDPSGRGTGSGTAPKVKSARGARDDASERDRPPAYGILQLEKQRPKYQITDMSGRLAERANATLELGWNVQPWVGALTWTNNASGPGRAAASGVTGSLAALVQKLGRWRPLEGGRSAAFDFPPLKGKKDDAAAAAASAADMGTVRGGERNRGSPA